MGMDKWFELIFMGPKDIRDLLLAKCSDFFRKELALYREAGVNLFLYANTLGSTDIVSIKQFDELAMPWMRKDLEGIDMNGLIYYCGSAKINRVLPKVFNDIGFGVFSMSPFDDIEEAKQLVDRQGIIAGVINDIKLLSWSEKEIRAEVKRIIDQGKGNGPFIFGTGLMPYNIPEESIRIMCEAAYEYGRF